MLMKVLAHPSGDAEGYGVVRDVVSKKSENSDNGTFTRRHAAVEVLLPKTAQGCFG